MRSVRPGRILANPSLNIVASSGVLILMTIVTGVLTARLLGPSDRGVYSSTLALASILGFTAVAGATEVLVLAPKRGIDRGTTYTAAWVYTATFATASTVFLFFYMSLNTQTNIYVTVMACILPLLCAVPPLINFSLIAKTRNGWASVIRVAPVATQIVGLLVIVTLDKVTLTTVFGTFVAGAFLAVIVGLCVDRPFSDFTLKPKMKRIPQLAQIGLSTGVTQACRAIVSRIDVILIAALLTTADAGYYSVAASITVAAASLIANLAPVILTRGSTGASDIVSPAVLLAIIMAVFIITAGPFLLPIVYGEAYSEAVSLLYGLALAMVLTSVFELIVRSVQRDGREKFALGAVVLASSLHVSLIVVACLFGGLMWIPFASACAYAIAIGCVFAIEKFHNRDSLLASVSPLRGVRVIRQAYRRSNP